MTEEYGLPGQALRHGLLPWRWGAKRLAASHGHWLATTRPDGRPHVMVVWGVWLDDGYYFATSRRSRKARNLAGNPHCVVCTAQTEEPVILEGTVEAVTGTAAIRRFHSRYRKKYKEDIDTRLFPVHRVRPSRAFGFISSAEHWAQTATRWRFDGGPPRDKTTVTRPAAR